MAPDRDLLVALGAALGRLRRGWEMLAATGIRGLRLAHETRALDALYLTERRAEAVATLARNAARVAGTPTAVARHDATRPLARAAFDYVDLDPYGTPAPFLTAALDALRAPGLLAVTATDMRVLAGVDRGVAEPRYGGTPLRGRLAPEAGLRLLLAHVHRLLRERSWRGRPVLAYVRDHHVRAYLRVDADGGAPSDPDPSIARIDPATWEGPRLPPGGPYGPLWVGPLFDPSLIARLTVPATAADPDGLARLLARLKDEVGADRPFFYEPNVLAQEEHRPQPASPGRILETLRAHGWAAGRTHARDGAFRTDAPRREVVRLLAEAGG